MTDIKPSRKFASGFLFNMLPTFLGVLLAFWLTEWASERDFKAKERHLLEEIQHELEVNLTDLRVNLNGHQAGLLSTKAMQRYLVDDTINQDSLPQHSVNALRDFISIQHTAAYETMKARGVESITNDTLRLHIADLYDFDFETIEKIEEKYAPHEFFVHYNEPFLRLISQCYNFMPGDVANRKIMPLSALPKEEKNLLSARLTKLKYDRLFSISAYEEVIKKVEIVIAAIKKELGT